jgi:diaminopimelate epimerase
MKFSRYHALGNDYIVMEASELPAPFSERVVERICHRHFGVGSDGILVHEPRRGDGAFSLRIFNPDGSQAEKSGNGLRIFSRYLWDRGLVQDSPFSVSTAGGDVIACVAAGGRLVTVDMGHVSFSSSVIPVSGATREVLNERLEVGGREISFCAATVGNPHCVVLDLEVTKENAERFGPLLERHPLFPNRTNVQLLRVVSRSEIQIEIWERGAGYTLASGSSSSAAAAVAHRLGLVDASMTVTMPGGQLSIDISDNYAIRMAGPVTRICDGVIYAECLQGA